MFGGDKTGISQLFVKHCAEIDYHPAMQRHLEKVEAIEALHCTYSGPSVVSKTGKNSSC